MLFTKYLFVPPDDTLNVNTYLFKADTGASKHFAKLKHKPLLEKIKTLPNGPIVILPNKATIHTAHSGHLPFPAILSPESTKALNYLDITNKSSLSIGQLYDNDCLAISKQFLHIFKNKNSYYKVIETRKTVYGIGLSYHDSLNNKLHQPI